MKKITWSISNVPLIEVNDVCLLNGWELDIENMEVVILDIRRKKWNYTKAKYIKLMQCPECGFYKLEENDGMPDRDDFTYKSDYVECPCGCRFRR